MIGMPEYVDRRIYNSAYFFCSNGTLVAKHRKIQLFGQYEKEIFTPGDNTTFFDTTFVWVKPEDTPFLKNGEYPSSVCCLYATSAFAKPTDITQAYNLLNLGKWNFVFSATSFDAQIARTFKLTRKGEGFKRRKER